MPSIYDEQRTAREAKAKLRSFIYTKTVAYRRSLWSLLRRNFLIRRHRQRTRYAFLRFIQNSLAVFIDFINASNINTNDENWAIVSFTFHSELLLIVSKNK